MAKVVAYVPVLHDGYLKFFESVAPNSSLYLVGPELKDLFPELKKEIREMPVEKAKKAIESLSIFSTIEILALSNLPLLNCSEEDIFLPDETVSRTLAERYFPQARTRFSPIFLRWDKHNATKEKPVVPDEMISKEELHKRVLIDAAAEGALSSDIWRHVGALVFKDGREILRAHNEHVPTEHAPYINGDPRNYFHKGEGMEYSSAIHAEAGIIAQAAKEGIVLKGAEMFITVFPCPPCAKLIARSGIKTLYCGGGYGVMDGQDILKDAGVKIFFVE